MGHRRFDRIGVRDGYDSTAGMALHQPGNGRDNPGLHFGERLSTREAKAARVALHHPPLRPLLKPAQLSPRPLTEVAFYQASIDAEGAVAGAHDRHGRLPCSLQR